MMPSTAILLRLVVCGLAFAYITTVYLLLRKSHYRTVGYMLVLFYMTLGAGTIWCWGINIPIGELIFGLAIVLAGILLTSRHSLFAALATAIILIGAQFVVSANIYEPKLVWGEGGRSTFGDVFGYCTVFGMLALISWLYNREMERSLAKAQKAEAALLEQRANLRLEVKKRTAQLRKAQLEELQQVYNFAKIGQTGVALLHDLANYLTALNLEVEGLQREQHSKTINRARIILSYLGKMVDDTRARLSGGSQKQAFSVAHVITETLAISQDKAARSNIAIDWQPPSGDWHYVGDAASLGQVVGIVLNNAIDAYESEPLKKFAKRAVAIRLKKEGSNIFIHIRDWGPGIAASGRRKLFKPLHSTKRAGFGLGLYIAKQTLEMEFGGNIHLDPTFDRTEFVIKLPAHST